MSVRRLGAALLASVTFGMLFWYLYTWGMGVPSIAGAVALSAVTVLLTQTAAGVNDAAA